MLHQVSFHLPEGKDVFTLFKEAFGEHYDLRLEEETIEIGEDQYGKVTSCDSVIRIYNKGDTTPKLSLWLI